MSVYRFTREQLADFYMADEMYRASPDGKADMERVRRVLEENSTPATITLSGHFCDHLCDHREHE